MMLRKGVALLAALTPAALLALVVYRTDAHDHRRLAWVLMGWFGVLAVLRTQRLVRNWVQLVLLLLPVATVLVWRTVVAMNEPAHSSFDVRAFDATLEASETCALLVLVGLPTTGLMALPCGLERPLLSRREATTDAGVVLALGCVLIASRAGYEPLLTIATVLCALGLSSRGATARRAGLTAVLVLGLVAILEAQDRSLSTVGLGWGPLPWTGGKGRHLAPNVASVGVTAIIVLAASLPRESFSQASWIVSYAIPLAVGFAAASSAGELRRLHIETAAPGWHHLQGVATRVAVVTACDAAAVEGGDIYLFDRGAARRVFAGAVAEHSVLVAPSDADVDGLLALPNNSARSTRLLTRHPGAPLWWGAARLRTCLVELATHSNMDLTAGAGGCIVETRNRLVCTGSGRLQRLTTASASWPEGAVAMSGDRALVVLLPAKARVGDALHFAVEAAAVLNDPRGWLFAPLPSAPALAVLRRAAAQPANLSAEFVAVNGDGGEQDVTAGHRAKILTALWACREAMPSESTLVVRATVTGAVALFDAPTESSNVCLGSLLPNLQGAGPAELRVKVGWGSKSDLH